MISEGAGVERKKKKARKAEEPVDAQPNGDSPKKKKKKSEA